MSHENLSASARVAAEAADSRPAVGGAANHGDADLPLGILRALDHFLVHVMDDLRDRPPFDKLAPPQWLVLQHIVAAWTHGLPGRSQAELARSVGCSPRTVRRLVVELEAAGILVSAHHAGCGVAYRAGPVLRPLLLEFGWWRDPTIWTRGVARLVPVPPTPVIHGTEVTPVLQLEVGQSKTTPDKYDSCPGALSPMTAERKRTPVIHDTEVTPEHRFEAGRSNTTPDKYDTPQAPLGEDNPNPSPLINKTNLRRSSSCSPEKGTPPATTPPATDRPAESTPEPTKRTPSPATPQPTTPRQVLSAQALRVAACRALTARYQQAYPNSPVPETFSAGDIDALVRVTARGTWTEAELDQVHLDALAGASAKSKSLPPTVSYVWGNPEYFARNARAGRTLREAATVAVPVKRPKKKEPEERFATTAEVYEIAKAAKAALSGPIAGEVTRSFDRRVLSDPSL
jgi:hypothetical protein